MRTARVLRGAALALLALPALALAEGPQCAPPQPSVVATRAADATAVQRMLELVPACQKDAAFLAALGQLLNRQGRYLEAAEHLERALMLAPELRDAQLSYAVALAGGGDAASAAALLDDLLADPALPPELRAPMQRQRAALAAPAQRPGWQGRFTLATRLGRDSNLLGAPNLGSLALTLAGQTLVLELDPSYLPRSGSTGRVDTQIALHRSDGDGVRWDALASLRSQASPALHAAGYTQADLLLERSQLTPTAQRSDAAAGAAGEAAGPAQGQRLGGGYANASVSALRSLAGARYVAQGLAAGWAGAWRPRADGRGWEKDNCQARMGAQWQERSYLSNPLLSGRYSGVAALASCEQPSGAQWLLGLRAGRELAREPARAGGDQRQGSLRLGASVPVAGLLPAAPSAVAAALEPLRRGTLVLDFEQGRQLDSSSYSALIDSGRTRTISRSAARLEYQGDLALSVQWLIGAEWVAQSSRLALFGMRSNGAYAGLRLGW